MKKYTWKEWSKTAKTLLSGEETKDYFASLLIDKEYKKIPEDNSDKCWPHYPFFEDELKPIGEEQMKMTDAEFHKWVKEQGY